MPGTQITNIAECKDFICTNSDEKCCSGVNVYSSLLTVSGDSVKHKIVMCVLSVV